MTNTKITDHVDNVTYDYISANAPQKVYDAPVGLSLMMNRADVVFHGGSDSIYPYIAAKINTNYYDHMVAGTIAAEVTPSSTDFQDAAHQEGWGHWYEHESISLEEQAANNVDWAKSETVIPLAKIKLDGFLDSIGWMFDKNIADGDASNNTITGLTKLMDITNTNYLGWNWTTETTLRPSNTTIATSYTTLTLADLFEAYGDIEDKGRNADCILLHTDVLKRLRTLAEATVDRSQGGHVSFGAKTFDVLDAEIIPWRLMPTTTSTKIYFLNFGNAVGRGVRGDSKPSVKEGKFFKLEFAGKRPLGFARTGWVDKTDQGFPGVRTIYAVGSFKMACTAPKHQAYISIA